MASGWLLFLAATTTGATAVVPEYARTLERVLVSVPAPLDRGTPSLRNELFWLYRELHGALPPYSEVLVAVLPEDRELTLSLLEGQSRTRRTTLHVVQAGSPELDHWAQDLGEPIFVDGDRKFLVSMPVEGSDAYNRELSRFRIAQARQLFGEDVIEADFVFEGGNLAFDVDEEGLLVLVGHNDVELTLASHRAMSIPLAREDVLARMSGRFGGARVVEVGRETQSPSLRHLDQAFVLVGEKVAVVNRIGGGAEAPEVEQLDQYKTQLERLGYRVEALEHTLEEIRGYRNSVNAVPFTDKITGQRNIIFPVFPGETAPGHEGELSRAHLRGKALRAFELYASLGYRPLPVRDFAFGAGGNTHCIANALE